MAVSGFLLTPRCNFQAFPLSISNACRLGMTTVMASCAITQRSTANSPLLAHERRPPLTRLRHQLGPANRESCNVRHNLVVSPKVRLRTVQPPCRTQLYLRIKRKGVCNHFPEITRVISSSGTSVPDRALVEEHLPLEPIILPDGTTQHIPPRAIRMGSLGLVGQKYSIVRDRFKNVVRRA